MTAANLNLLSEYQQFVQLAVSAGHSVQQATPAAFERFQAQPEALRATMDEAALRQLINAPTTLDEQMSVAREVMSDRKAVLKRLAE